MSRPIIIDAPEIYSFSETLWYLDRGFDDCSHRVEGGAVLKAVRFEDGIILFKVSGGNELLRIEILSGDTNTAAEAFLISYVRKWFDLDRDIAPFYELLQNDERVAFMREAYYGFRPVGINELYEALSWSIIGQQINLAFAFRMKRRLAEKYGDSIEFGDNVHYIFPLPEALAHADPDDLREMQFSQRKAEYLIGLAAKFSDGSISEAIIADLPDFELKQQALVSIRGIGIWTANYALMKSMQIPEAVPYGDAGLFNALTDLHIIAERSDKRGIEAFFDKFPNWQHYMVYYLWRSRSGMLINSRK